MPHVKITFLYCLCFKQQINVYQKYILYMYRYEISKETFPQKYLDNKFSKCNRLLYEEMF